MPDKKTDPSNTDGKQDPNADADDGKGGGKDDGTVKGRISDLVKERDAEREARSKAEKELQAYKEKEAKAAQDKAIEEGKIKEVLAEKEKALADVQANLDSTQKVLKEYEESTKAGVQKGIEGIQDEKKRATVQKMLEGKTPAQQAQLLPDLLEAIGLPAQAGFGNNTPANPPPNTGTAQAKLDEFRKLYDKSKSQKLTPEEDRRFRELSSDTEMNKLAKDERDKRQKQASTDDSEANRFS